MYQWRKFEFFEEKYAGKCLVPDEVAGKIECCTSGRGKIAVGCEDGTVSLLDRGFKFSYGFQAHTSSVLFLQQLKVSFFHPSLSITSYYSSFTPNCSDIYAIVPILSHFVHEFINLEHNPFARTFFRFSCTKRKQISERRYEIGL